MTYLKPAIGTKGVALRPGAPGVHSVCPAYNILASKNTNQVPFKRSCSGEY